MRTRHLLTRVLVPGAALLGLGAASVPLASGRWDPPWLRVAPPPSDAARATDLEVPRIDAPFRAEQLGADGELRWRLSGQRVTSTSFREHQLERPLLELFRAGRPWARLEAAEGHVHLPAEDEPGAPARLTLTGDVLLTRGPLRARTAEVQVEAAQGFDLLDVSGGEGSLRLRAPTPVALDVAPIAAGGDATGAPTHGPWRLEAAGLEGTLEPFELDLQGPVRFSGGPLAGEHVLSGQLLSGEAASGLLSGDAPPAGGWPEALDLELQAVRVTGRSDAGATSAWRSDHLDLRWRARPATARAALGGVAGVDRRSNVDVGPWGYAPTLARATGDVLLEVTRPAPQPLDLSVRGDDVRLDTLRGLLEAEGRPARLREASDGLDVAAPRLTAERLPEGVRLTGRGGVRFGLDLAATERSGPSAWDGTAGELDVTVAPAAPAPVAPEPPAWTRLLALRASGSAFGAPVRLARRDGAGWLEAGSLRYELERDEGRVAFGGGVRGRVPADLADGAPWVLEAARLEASFDAAALARASGREQATDAAGPPGPDWREVLRSAEAEGDPARFARDGDDPRRHRGLAGERLTWSADAGRVAARGAARVDVGELALTTPDLTYDLNTGELAGAGGLLLTGHLRHRDEALPLEVRAATGRAVLDPEPARWDEDRALRRAARAEEVSFLPPVPLRSLDLRGAGSERVTVRGPRGLEAAADRFRYTAERHEARLDADEGAPPVAVAWTQGRLEARRAGVWLAGLEPRPTYWVALTGDVHLVGDPRALADLRAEGAAAADAEASGWQGSLRCAWLLAQVVDPPAGWRGIPVGPFGAGGGVGLAADPAAPDAPPLEAQAERILGTGWRERALLLAAPGEQVSVSRGDATLAAGRAGLALRDGREALALELGGGWTASLPRAEGPLAGKGRRLDLTLDLGAARGGRAAAEGDAAYARRLLRRLEAAGGMRLEGPGLAAQAQRAHLDAARGTYLLEGDPAEVVREGVRTRAAEVELRFD